jgi:hypothetical protein
MERKRAFHARLLAEYTAMLNTCPPDWLCMESLVYLRAIANYELRMVEFEMASFRLTTLSLGIGAKNREDLMSAASVLYSTFMWMVDRQERKDLAKRKIYSQFIHMKPGPSDSKKALCSSINELMFALRSIMKIGLAYKDDDEKIRVMTHLSEKFTFIIKSLDLVLVKV